MKGGIIGWICTRGATFSHALSVFQASTWTGELSESWAVPIDCGWVGLGLNDRQGDASWETWRLSKTTDLWVDRLIE